MPGSVNAKIGKSHRVQILHMMVQDMNEEVFLQLVPKETFKVVDDRLTAGGEPLPKRTKTEDRSASDWHLVCQFFEENPDASETDAKNALKEHWQAQRPNQQYYIDITVRKGLQHVRKLQNESARQGLGMSQTASLTIGFV